MTTARVAEKSEKPPCVCEQNVQYTVVSSRRYVHAMCTVGDTTLDIERSITVFAWNTAVVERANVRVAYLHSY